MVTCVCGGEWGGEVVREEADNGGQWVHTQTGAPLPESESQRRDLGRVASLSLPIPSSEKPCRGQWSAPPNSCYGAGAGVSTVPNTQ